MTIWFLRDMGGKNYTDTAFASVRSGKLFILKNVVMAKYSRLEITTPTPLQVKIKW